MRSNAYCGNLLWQSNLTLQAPVGLTSRRSIAWSSPRLRREKRQDLSARASRARVVAMRTGIKGETKTVSLL